MIINPEKLPSMKMQKASSVVLTVVSVKKSEAFILRGVKKWTSPEAMRLKMLPYVAVFENPDVLEWTWYDYVIPYYLAYEGHGYDVLNTLQDGLYIHRWVCHDNYGPGQKVEAW